MQLPPAGRKRLSPAPRALAKSDYVALSRFRTILREFLRFSEGAARAAGLTPQQHQLLLAVRGQRGREWALVGELAHALQLRHHTAVELIDRCVLVGMVRREVDARDRRRVRVRLTVRGRRTLDRLTLRNRRELIGLRRALDLALLPNERHARRGTAALQG